MFRSRHGQDGAGEQGLGSLLLGKSLNPTPSIIDLPSVGQRQRPVCTLVQCRTSVRGERGGGIMECGVHKKRKHL